jgi:hypothetical protein
MVNVFRYLLYSICMQNHNMVWIWTETYDYAASKGIFLEGRGSSEKSTFCFETYPNIFFMVA